MTRFVTTIGLALAVLNAAIVTVVAQSATAPGQVSVQRSGPYTNRRLSDVLRDLQRRGLRIIFSDELVRPDMRVVTEPRAHEPRAMLTELLAPHRLGVQEGAGGTLTIVRTASQSAPLRPSLKQGSGTAPERLPSDDARQRPDLPHIEEHLEVSATLPLVLAEPTTNDVRPNQVRDTAGAFENPLQALQMMPGVAAVNDQEGRLAIRGTGAEHNLILLDGVPVRNPFRTTYVPTSLFNPSTIARVAIDASGLDAGLGGLSSAIAIETRDGTTAERLAGSGSVNLLNGDIVFEGRTPGTSNGSWLVSGRGTHYDLIADRYSNGGDQPGFRDVQFKTTVYPSSRTRLSFAGLAGHGSMKEPDNAGSGDRFDTSNYLGLVTLRWAPSTRLVTTTSASTYVDASHFFDFPADADNQFDRRTRMHEVALRHTTTLRAGTRHLLDIGVDARHLDTSLFLQGRDAPDWFTSAGPNLWGQHVTYLNGPLDSRLSKTEMASWIQDEIAVTPSVSVRPGLRVAWNSLTGETALLPRVLVTKRFGASTKGWSGIAWQAQTPGHETMLAGIAAYDFGGLGRGALRNERARQMVLGMEHRFGHSNALRVEGYHRTFDRLLVQRLETDAERAARLAAFDLPPDMPTESAYLEHRPTIYPESTGKGRAFGVEVLLQRETGRATGFVSYTWSKADRQLFGRTVPFDFDRRHALELAGAFAISPRVTLSASWHLASGYPVTPNSPDVEFFVDREDRDHDGNVTESIPLRDGSGRLVLLPPVSVGPRLSVFNSDRLSMYARADVRLTFVRGRWEYYGEVINLFGRRNHVQVGAPDGGAFRGEVYGSYERLPSFGVRVRF